MMDNGHSNPGFIESIKSCSNFKMFPTPEQIKSVSESLLMTTMLATASSRTLGYHEGCITSSPLAQVFSTLREPWVIGTCD